MSRGYHRRIYGRGLFFLAFSKCFWNVNVTLLLYVLKSEVFILKGVGGGGGGLGPLFLNFLDPSLVMFRISDLGNPTAQWTQNYLTNIFSYLANLFSIIKLQ